MKKIAILNSRQGLHPCRNDAWVLKSSEVLESISPIDTMIVSSIGMSTWDLMTIAASEKKFHLELHVTEPIHLSKSQFENMLIKDYALNKNLVNFVYHHSESSFDFRTTRDRSIIESADILYPVSLRDRGNLQKLISQNTNKINDRFSIPYKKKNQNLAYSMTHSFINSELMKFRNRYFIHWTKTPKDKWYHESTASYYEAVLQSDVYPRSAFFTLQNILHTQMIISTSTHMPQQIKTVSFSSLAPLEMLPLFKWRSRYSEMSFEPYGIGVLKNSESAAKIKKVIYYDKNQHKNIQLSKIISGELNHSD